MIYFCVDGKQKQILEVSGAEAVPSLQLLLPCAALCSLVCCHSHDV